MMVYYGEEELKLRGEGKVKSVPKFDSDGDSFVLPNMSGQVPRTPTGNYDIANKAYVDGVVPTNYIKDDGADSATGPITLTADNGTADQAYVPMVLYNTDATPPAANTVPYGTLYVQYTA